MTTIPVDVQAEIARLMATGRYESELALLRSALSALEAHHADLAAIEEGIADMDNGRVHALAEVQAEIRAQHGWTAGS